MRTPILPAFILTILAAALYLLPDGVFYSWQLALRGAVARLYRPSDPRADASQATFSDCRDALELLSQKEAQIAGLNRRLRELEIAREAVENVRIVAAKVVRLGPSNNLDTFTIDVGVRDGVAPGQAVVSGRSLVGVVVESGPEASLVLSLASTGCYISARLGEPEGTVGRPRLLGAVRGGGGGTVLAIVFSSGTAAKEGWLAVTSGLEEHIPDGLDIGRVVGGFGPGTEDGTLEAVLSPDVELANLDFVTVLIRR